MQLWLLTLLIILGGCATKYVVPTNRFITPESQGGVFNGQLELQYTQAHQPTLITNTGSINEGVFYTTVPRTGYMLSNSFYDSFDFIWAHIAAGNSMGGGKIQILGASRTGKATGHKLAIVGLFGGNEHETRDESVKFRLDGREFLLVYGYRITESVMPYISFSQSTYNFTATLTSPYPEINGQEPDVTTNLKGLNIGGDFSFNAVFVKAEISYQEIETTDTKNKTATSIGFSAGFNW